VVPFGFVGVAGRVGVLAAGRVPEKAQKRDEITFIGKEREKIVPELGL
jgi:hypothetical protein